MSPEPPFAYYNFHDACDWHDLCYHHRYFGDGSDGRKGCDDAFLSRMKSWCGNRYDSGWQLPLKGSCNDAALIYYRVVRTVGARGVLAGEVEHGRRGVSGDYPVTGVDQMPGEEPTTASQFEHESATLSHRPQQGQDPWRAPIGMKAEPQVMDHR